MAKKPTSIMELPASITDEVPASLRILTEIAPALERDLRLLSSELVALRESSNAMKMARAFVALHQIKETLKAISGDGGTFPAMYGLQKSEVVPNIFEREGIGGSKTGGTGRSLSLSEGFRVGTSIKMVVSIKVENRPKAFEWLRSNRLGDLIQETVNPQSLSSTAQTMMEETGVEMPEDIFTVHAKNNTSVTRIAKK